MGVSNSQSNGVQDPTPIKFLYRGTALIPEGGMLCFNWDSSTVADRTVEVEQPSLNNIRFFCGFAKKSVPADSAGSDRWIDVVPAWNNCDGVAIATDQSVTAGDFLGPAPGTFYAHPAVCGMPVFRATSTSDRSSTAGTVVGRWGYCNMADPDLARHMYEYFDHFNAAGYSRDLALANESDPAAKFSEVADCGEWLVTVTDGGAGSAENITILDGVAGGILRITNNAADNDVVDCQKNGDSFLLSAGKSLYMSMRVRVPDVSNSDWFVGLSSADTATVASLANDHIGFGCINSAASEILALTRDRAGTATSMTAIAAASNADNTFHFLEVYVNWRSGAAAAAVWSIQAAVDGTNLSGASLGTTPDQDLPDAALAPVIAHRNNGAQANLLDVDFLRVRQNL